jgi:hypothetical protein
VLLWQAECRECALSHWTPLSTARLVKVFDNHVDRDNWRRQHMELTGHWVGCRCLVVDAPETPTNSTC